MRPLMQGGRSWAPVPRSRMGVLPAGGALMPCPGGPLSDPPAGRRAGESQSTRQGCTAAHLGPGNRSLPHTHLLCVSDCHTAGASHSGCSLDHPQPPTCAQPFLCPRPASCTLSTPPSRPWHKRRCVLPLRLRPLPSRSFIHSTKRSLNTHQVPGSVPGAEDPIGRRKKRNRQTLLLSWHLPSDRR